MSLRKNNALFVRLMSYKRQRLGFSTGLAGRLYVVTAVDRELVSIFSELRAQSLDAPQPPAGTSISNNANVNVFQVQHMHLDASLFEALVGGRFEKK